MVRTGQAGPKTTVHDSDPPRPSNEFPDLENLDRPELDEDEEDWAEKSSVLRKRYERDVDTDRAVKTGGLCA